MFPNICKPLAYHIYCMALIHSQTQGHMIISYLQVLGFFVGTQNNRLTFRQKYVWFEKQENKCLISHPHLKGLKEQHKYQILQMWKL